ncbi:amino acid adenylation domain-containing protein [Streptomyces sp. NBC_00249]|uniref:non-ribosomal peptide synthetase n=1 Tax=Streptomyces sp. NBC_00249 TaxID=2975690 RepID=UPI002259EF53|nr:non-ribosomal peptide synthetase [Streptomyces sp. NBC_00249]MCX5193515.1 amino acid adenylation domain-containing protein [Streptomyces sp. NBC_00249]
MPRFDNHAQLIPTDCAPSGHVHALRIRLSEGADTSRLARVLEGAAGLWWPQAAERQPKVWSEPVPAAAGSAIADRRLQSELQRPLDPDHALLRVGVLEYADGPADLVLVAHRGFLDAASLRHVADVLLGRAPAERFSAVAVGRPAPADGELRKLWSEAEFAGRAEWAVADGSAKDRTGVVRVELRCTAADEPGTLAVATGLVLGRYENQDTPVIGALTVQPGRPADALGAFDAGTLLPIDLSGARATAELVGEAGRLLSGAGTLCDRRQYADLVAESGGRVLAGVINPAGHQADSGAETYLPCQSAPFPLSVTLRHHADGGAFLEVHHRLADVDEASAQQFARHLARAFEQLADGAPELVPADVDLLDDEERAALVALGRPARSLEWQPRRIDEVFAEHAAERPEAVALSYEGQTLTYAELNERADRFAGALHALGVRAGERVGICLDRSTDLVVTMLAVLKADAVYVPMDPAYPADRLAYTAEDAGLRFVVTTLDEFPAAGQTRTIRPEELAATAPSAAPAPGRGNEQAAYIIYTSGSTGRPKGVVVPHRNVVALLSATTEDFRLGPDDTWTLFHSSAFDFSVWEIWGPLLTGARLVVVPYWVSRSPEEFRELLRSERVTVVNQTPSAFAQLVEADRRQAPDLALRLVVFGGEPLDARGLRGWFDRYPESRCRLVNMFGITETTVHVTAQTVGRKEAMTGSRSVGPALPGWYLYVLDERQRPVPLGVPGEIYVGGEGVALEYLGRPELTAERFTTDPFTGGRMYRSGDKGRLRPDGRLEHLGRLDTQVKLRGFRIELDEIRNVLLDDPTVTAAAVVLGGADTQDSAAVRLDAYVVLDGGDTAAVRRRAAKVLPEYMLPTTVTPLPALPLTANGKLDARRLPAPAAPAAANAPAAPAPAAAVAASAPAEAAPLSPADPAATGGGLAEELTEVWQAVLGVPVGPDDSFFELGGNSLYAVRLAAAMRERGLPALPLRELYLNPTVSRLAAVLAPGDQA